MLRSRAEVWNGFSWRWFSFIGCWRLCSVNDLSTVTIKIILTYHVLSTLPVLERVTNSTFFLTKQNIFFAVRLSCWSGIVWKFIVPLFRSVTRRTSSQSDGSIMKLFTLLWDRAGHFNFIVAPVKRHFTLQSWIQLMFYCNLICFNFVSYI